MNSLFERFIAAILSLFLITYTGYQAYRYIYTKYQTETAYNYTVSDTMKTRGLFIRDEEVIPEIPTGIVDYLHGDGTKVSEGSAIAEVYQSAADVKNQKRIRELDEEIKMLEMAQSQASSQTTHADILNRQISEQVGKLVDASASSRTDAVSDTSKQLALLLNKKQIAIGKISDLNSRILRLQNQKDYYTDAIASKYQVLKSPFSGYFVRDIDGMEDIISPANMQETSIEEYKRLIYGAPEQGTNNIGKIVKSHNWYMAVFATKDNAAKFKVGTEVELDFGLSGIRGVPATVDSIIPSEDGKENIILLHCNYIIPELISKRNTDVIINFKTYTGLKISPAAVRFQDDKKGVFIKQGHEIRFKTIETVYEESGFILCKDSVENTGLRLFDEVIVEGTELYDGKGIK